MGFLSADISGVTAADSQEEFIANRAAIAFSRLLVIRSWGDSGWMSTMGESTGPWPSRSSEQMLSPLAVLKHRPDSPGLAKAR